MMLPYHCKSCGKYFFKYVPNCEINKNITNCPSCGRKAVLEEQKPQDYLDKNNPYWKDTEDIYRKAEAAGDEETIFKCMHRLCHAICCKKLNKLGMSTEEIYEKGLDCTIHAMEKRNNKYFKEHGGMCYRTLAAWCYYSVLYVLYRRNKQDVFEDSIVFDDGELLKIVSEENR